MSDGDGGGWGDGRRVWGLGNGRWAGGITKKYSLQLGEMKKIFLLQIIKPLLFFDVLRALT